MGVSFLELCAEVGADVTEVIDHANAADHALATDEPSAMEEYWYKGVAAGDPPWDIYTSDAYLGEAWCGWKHHSGQHLRLFVNKGPKLDPPRRVIDLGCGIGWSTGAMCKVWPEADVYGTQLPSKQADVARLLSEREGLGFTIVDDASAVPHPVDLLFASEYFEHFEAPVAHLEDVMEATDRPRVVVVANTFGQPAPGHFDTYLVGDQRCGGKATSRAWNDRMRAFGYDKLRTGFWNGRPAVWVRSSP